jgi:DNA-binding beta-propeller fold protein YncE/DNA-directed RNA polymerase subunit RPC12/RpoP
MPDSFNCPNCGAPLDYKGSDPIIRCPYCSTSVVVPENLRAKPSFSSKPSNFTLSGMGDMGGLIQQARRIKDVKDMAQSGRMDEAVKLYQEITGANEFQANAAVQALSQGQPITLTNFSPASYPSPGYSPANISAQAIQQSVQASAQASKTASRMGCLIGCFVTGLTLFILAATMIPIFAASIPLFLADPNMPVAIQTMIPAVSTSMPEIPAIVPTVHTFGQQELSFGGEGTGPGLFTDPRAIALDPKSGNIYVADYQGGRVQAFDSAGKFITQWKVGDKKTIITGMAADRKGNVFVVSVSNIYRYNGSTGELLNQIKAGDKVTYHFDDITSASDGTLYAIGGGETVVKMDIDGKTLLTIPKAISTVTEDPELSARIAVDGEGNIYLLGRFNNAVFKFNPDGKYINKFGSDGDEPGQFRAPYAIAVDGQGNVYVSDIKGIQAFDKDGRYIDVIDLKGACFGMVFDDEGKLYASTNVSKILKFAISK